MTEATGFAPPSPYKGLAPFGESDVDASLFFGRERESKVIAANVMASRFTVLYGPLGVGKSSVLRAGVVRRLRAVAPDATVVVHDSWAGDSADGLLGAVTGALGAGAPSPGVRLGDALTELAAGAAGDLYLVLDQFEEVFVYPGADELAASLAEVVTRPGLRADVLIALREDSLAELDVFTGRIPNVFGNYLALDRLDRAAARAAVTGPIARFNELSGEPPVEIEDDLVEAVLDQVEVGRVAMGGENGDAAPAVGAGRIEAPYLQLVLERLWQAERSQGSSVLRLETLYELGGAEAIVRSHLDEAVRGLGPGQQDLAARVFNHLVTPSGTKIAHGADDLAQYAGVGEDDLRPVLASLGASRIVRPVDGRYEIYHDVLADPVLAWRTRHERERALEQQRSESERRHRRLVALLASSLLVLAVMAAVTVYALTQRSEARAEEREATSSRLAGEAGLLIPAAQAELDPELALLLAAEAAKIAPTPRAVDTLRRALLVSHLRTVVPEAGVASAAFSPDGSRLVVGTEGGSAAIYDADTRSKLATLQTDRPVTTAAFSPDGESVLTTEAGGPARIWDAAAGTSLRSLGGTPTAASYSPDGSLVVTAEPSGTRVWQADDGAPVATLPQEGPVRQAAFGPDGDLVATVGADSKARVFDARTGDLLATVEHGGEVTGATIAPGGDQLVTTGADGVARIWALDRGGRLLRELTGHRGPLTAGVVSGDGTRLVTTSQDGTARLWELPSGRFVAELLGHAGRVTGAAFSDDSESVVTWGAGGTARVGDARTGAARALLAGHGEAVTGASFDSSGDFVLTTSANGQARLWRSRVEAELRPVGSVPAPVSAAAFSGDGSVVAASSPSGVEIVESGDGEQVATVATTPTRVLAASRDGSWVATVSGTSVSLWRAGVAEPEAVVDGGETVTAVAFAGDADRVAVGTMGGTISVHTVDGGRVSSLDGSGEPVTAVAFDPSGDNVAAGFEDGMLGAWTTGDGERLYLGAGHGNGARVASLAFSPDGGRLVSGGGDSTARVWDAATGRLLYSLRGHSGTVRSASFSPDGEWIVTAGATIVGVWDPSTRQRLFFLQGNGGRFLAASFGPGSRDIATMATDGTLSSYACGICGGIEELLALAESRLAGTGRELTPEERRHYLGD
jgi:WD40 repeat protein